MKAKWYIGAIIIMCTLFGVVKQQQAPLPNQEIVLQFTNTALSSTQVNSTLTVLKQQLEHLGVRHLKVVKGPLKGQLKISYLSTVSVSVIKEKLASQKKYNHNLVDAQGLPINRSFGYNIDVYDIQKNLDLHDSANGKYVLQSKLKNERSFQTDYSFVALSVNLKLQNHFVKIAYKVSYKNYLEIEETLHVIPEVRAGPLV